MKTSSAKNKGRRLQQDVAKKVLLKYPELNSDDVRSVPMGVSGNDLLLSQRAKQIFPYFVECKNTERINIWDVINSTNERALKDNLNPLVVIKKNRQKPYVCMPIDYFFKLL